MALMGDKNALPFFTVISKEGMDFVDTFENLPESMETLGIQKVSETPSMTTNIDTIPLETSKQRKYKKWVKVESCVNNCHLRVSEEDQKHNFDSYWQNSSVSSRYKFVDDMTKLSSSQESHKNSIISINEKKYYSAFSLNTFEGCKNVCRACFRFILGEQDPFITAVLVQKLINPGNSYDCQDENIEVKGTLENEINSDNVSTNDSSIDDVKDYNLLGYMNQLPPCSMNCNRFVSADDRKQNFHYYWHNTIIDQRCKFICDMTEITENEKCKNNPNYLIKPYTSSFYIKTKNHQNRQNVCVNCFHNIFKEAACIVSEVLNEKWIEFSSELVDGEKFNEIISHIKKFPLVESHHVADTGTEKYLSRGLTLEKMYNLYKEDVPNPVNFLAYQRIFSKSKVNFLSSILDKCVQCETATQESNSANLFKDKISLDSFMFSHLNMAQKAHSFKSRDEKKKCQSLMVFSFKFHESLPTPLLDNPVYYYKQPLWSYNFTITRTSWYKSVVGSFKSYVWDETQGTKSVNEIASCLYDYLQDLPPNIKTVIIYSSSCNGESRSKLLCMILSDLVMKHKTLNLLEHKFLLDGHFNFDNSKKNDWCQNILDQEIGKIEEPQDWYNVLSETALKYNSEVVIMKDKLYDFKGLLGGFFVGWMDGGMIDDDVTCVQYDKSGNVFFKRKWTGIYEKMFSKSNLELQYRNFCKEDLRKLSRIPLTEKKKKDLLDLLPFLSPRVHDFYKNLPGQNDSLLEDTSVSLNLKKEIHQGEKVPISTSENLDVIAEKQCDINLDKEKQESTSEDLSHPDKEEPTGFCTVIKKEPCDKFSEDEVEEEIEPNLVGTGNSSEFEENTEENSSIETPIFSNNRGFQVELFNKEFYETASSVNAKEIINNFEKTSNQKKKFKGIKHFQILGHCTNLCYLKVTPKDQERIFLSYWHTGTADSRFRFLYETIKLVPGAQKSEKRLDDLTFSVHFCLTTDHGSQNVCKFCLSKVLSERISDIITVIKLKSQAFIEGLKAEISNIEKESEQSLESFSRMERLSGEDILQWKASVYDCPMSRLLRNEKLQKGWTRLQPCRNGCFLSIKSEDQNEIYNSYWQGATFHSRYNFIQASSKSSKAHNSTENGSKNWRKYYHNSSKGPQRVCKRCFCLVLGETVKFVETVLRKTGVPIIKKIICKTSKPVFNDYVKASNSNAVDKEVSISKSGERADVSSSKVIDYNFQKDSTQQSPLTLEHCQEKTNKESMKRMLILEKEFLPLQMGDNKIVSTGVIEEHVNKFLLTKMNENHSSLRISVPLMYAHYVKEVSDPLSIGWYQNILAQNKVGFKPAFVGKCEVCETSAERFALSEDLSVKEKFCKHLTSHLNCTKIVYTCKFQEEESARLMNSIMVCSFGFQQNFIIPSRFNSSLQEHPLSVFNLTILQRTNNHVLSNPMFYVWPEIEGKRSANEIASCLYRYLKELPSNVKSLIIYSSSCHGESRSKTLSMMFAYLITNHKSLVAVDHKFAYSGHSQLKEYIDDRWVDKIMEDNFIKAEEPQDWYENFQNTTKRKEASNFVFMKPNMFYDFESLWKNPSVDDNPYIDKEVMWLKYTKTGNVFFKKSLLERHNFEVMTLQGQYQFKDLLNLELCNLGANFTATAAAETEVEQSNSMAAVSSEKCIIKTEIDVEEHYDQYSDQEDKNYAGPSSKRKFSEEVPLESESLRSKRIRKKKQVFSL